MCSLQSARSSARFHGEREGQAAAALPPWTGSLCERPESPQCWRIKPKKEKRQRDCHKLSIYGGFFCTLFSSSRAPKIARINSLAYTTLLWSVALDVGISEDTE